MSDLVKKKRSRTGIINYINKIIKSDVADIYDEFEEENLPKLSSLKNIAEEKLLKVVKLSEENTRIN